MTSFNQVKHFLIQQNPVKIGRFTFLVVSGLCTISVTVGRYERDEVKPSIEVAAKIADALEVSLDYLVGSSAFTVKDKKMMHRLELLEQLEDDDRDALLKVVDNYLTTAQLHTTTKKLNKKAS